MSQWRKPTQSEMQPPDLSTFRQDYSCNWLWYGGLSSAEVNNLPYGSRYWALYAPTANSKVWYYTCFEIRKHAELEGVRKATGRAFYRAHVVIHRIELDKAPFAWSPSDKTQKELDEMEVQLLHEDNSAAWLDYIETGVASKEVAKVLPTLGSYEKDAA
jgi:hypothetical protein